LVGHRSSWKWWVGVLGTATLLRVLVALVLLGAMPMVSDARDYFDVAARLASGDFREAFYWPPGESLVLAWAFAAFGKHLLVARLVTIATSVGTVGLTALVARELGGERASQIAGWIGALYAPSALLCGQTYAQHLCALCLAAVAYFGLRGLRDPRPTFWALTGAALGLGCLTRPSMASIIPILVGAWALTARRHRGALGRLVLGAALAACVALAFVLPTQVHNARAGAGWTLSTNNERNLFLGNNPYTPDYKTSHLGQRSLDELDKDARDYLESYYTRPDSRSAMQHAALAYMTHHPLRTAWRTINRALSFWGFDYLASREIQTWRGWRGRSGSPLIALEAGSYLAVAGSALAAIVGLSAACAPSRTWLIALTLAYQAPYTIAFSGGTYHFPVMPLVMPFAAVAVATGVEALRRSRSSRAVMVALGVFAAVQAEYTYFAVSMRAPPAVVAAG
jgi:4-amino-4-deoxy-L-arabinose transferase-like glycosyltransferase